MKKLFTICVYLCLAVFLSAPVCAALSTNETEAEVWFENINTQLALKANKASKAAWKYNTNINDANSKEMIAASLESDKYRKEVQKEATRLFDWKKFKNERLQRIFLKLTDIGTAAMTDSNKLQRLTQIVSEMETLYSTAKVKIDGKDASLSPDLTKLFHTSRDSEKLKEAWKGWRDASGKKMRNLYTEFVKLHNEGIVANGYKNTAEYWQSWYEYPTTEEFETDMARLFDEVKEFYQHMHYYVKQKLKKVYGNGIFPKSGQIPAHLLGNMWAQAWGTTLNITQPFPDQPSIDVTPAMIKQGYNATRMFQLSEEFFRSLGLFKMTDEFWANSMIVKPKDREVVCHASAWDFSDKKDFRIKQCTVVTLDDLVTVHHEMGHIQYYQQYKDEPQVFRRGANPGFHEAVGDLLALSVSTPNHLKKIKLLETVPDNSNYDINFLFAMALDKMGFIPFGYLIDKWRWDVFNGKITDKDYNKKWWDLRCSIQGVSPPVERSEADFDPGAKYHIPGNTPYIRYFFSHILQFQFHQALCKIAQPGVALHKCDIDLSTAAGTKLADGLKLGSSKHWKVAMKAITGEETISTVGLKEYFKPLIEFLKKENGDANVAWENNCPGDDASSLKSNLFMSVIFAAIATLLSRQI